MNKYDQDTSQHVNDADCSRNALRNYLDRYKNHERDMNEQMEAAKHKQQARRRKLRQQRREMQREERKNRFTEQRRQQNFQPSDESPKKSTIDRVADRGFSRAPATTHGPKSFR